MLLELNFSTCFLELAFDLLSLLLGNTLLNGLGSTVNKCLSIAQRKTCDVLHYLDNLELGLTCSLQDNVERRLLGGSSLACACSGSCNGNSGSRTIGASHVTSGTAWRIMFDPISARLASSFCRNGIRAVATENTIRGDTSM